jgi:hypothetical protein
MPASFNNVTSVSKVAGADLSTPATQYRFGKINPNPVTGASPSVGDAFGYAGAAQNLTVAAGNVIVNTTNGGQAHGVIVGQAVFGDPVEFAIGGEVPITLGAVVAAGDSLQSDATGAAITQTGSGHILGIASAAGIGGDQITMIWSPRGEA